MSRTTLGQRFASLFADPAAHEMLARLRPRTRLPVFNLTATSLRHLRRWFDRLEDINNGRIGSHGNFLSDPAGIGLVDNSVNPPVLTPAGQKFLSYRPLLSNDPAQAEYQLLKTLYFSNYTHEPKVQRLLEERRGHMLNILRQLNPPRREFLSRPSLLVVAELIASFPGALPRFLSLPSRDLTQLAELGDEGFQALGSGANVPTGLSCLCRRIGSDYTRAEERRLHYIVSMALLTIAQAIPPGGTTVLQVPFSYSNLLTAQNIFELHTKYTSDISVWFDGVDYQVSRGMTILTPVRVPGKIAPLQSVGLQPQTGTPRGTDRAAANHQSRGARRATQQAQVTVIINPLLSEAAEDYVEETLLRPQYGARLVRVGHRSGEVLALLDGIVPGADFYVIDAANNPIEFIEIKGVVA